MRRVLVVVFGLLAYGPVFGQVPTVGLDVPVEAFVGESFCFTLDFTNVGDPGYGPYLLITLPPELSFDSATLNGLTTTATLVDTFPPGGELEDPISGEMVSGQVGGSLYLIQPPIGSVVEGGQDLEFEVCSTIDIDAMVGMPLDIAVTPGYEFGDSPTGDNGPILGTEQTDAVTPTLILFVKESSAPENERSPGPSWPFDFILTADIADAQTVFNLQYADALPANAQYVGPISITGGSGCQVITEPSTETPGGALAVTCDEATGTLSETDLVVSFPVFIIDVLDEATCGTEELLNTATLDAEGEKPRGSGNLFALPQLADDEIVSAKHVPVQKSVSLDLAVPGDIVTYTVSFQVSDFANADSFLYRDILPDGMTFDAHVSLTVDGNAVTVAPIVTVNGDGTTTLDYDIGAVAGQVPGGATTTLVYTATIAQLFADGGAVLASDLLVNSAEVVVDLDGGAAGCSDLSSASVRIVPIEISKSIVNLQVEYEPGDFVTFLLEMPIASGDTSGIVFTDFFPLPVFDATLIDTTYGNDIRRAPSDTLDLVPTAITADAGTNSVEIVWPDVDTELPQVLAVEVDVLVLDEPFADNLALANFFGAATENTGGESQAATAPVLLNIGSPALTIAKGISATSNPESAISPDPSDEPIDGDLTGGDAGDDITYVITVENIGGAESYGVRVTDSGAAGLSSCTVDSVTDGDGTGLATTGDLFGAGLVLTDPLAENDENPPGGGSPFSSDTALIAVLCEIDGSVQPGELITNSAGATFASQPDATPHPEVTDTASITVASSDLSKTVDSIVPDYTGSDTTVHIGELVTYEVVIELPEGTHQEATLVDRLDTGLAFVDPDVVLIGITPTAGVSTDVAGGFPQIAADAVVSSDGSGPTAPDRRLTLDFGTLTVVPSDIASSETITVVYQVRVLNWDSNSRSESRRNRADWQWSAPAGGTDSVRVRAPNVTIVEAELDVLKSILPENGDAGDTVTVTLTVRHDPASNAEAFDVSLADVVPAGLTPVGTVATQNCSQTPTSGPTVSGQTVSAGWTNFPPGAVCEVVFDVTLDATVSSGSTIENCAEVDWQSLNDADQPLASPATNTLGAERTGNPADLGGVANLYIDEGCDTIKVTDVTVNKGVVATSEDSTGEEQGSGSIVDLVIGETVTFEFVATLPEGTTQPLVVTDSLPFSPGVLALVAGRSTVETVGDSITVPVGFPTVVESDEALGDGHLDTAVFTFATDVSPGVVVTDCAVEADCQITMRVEAIVVDLAANRDGDTLTNSVITQYGNGLSGSDTVAVELVEPLLSIEKSGDKTHASGEETVTYTLTVEHLPGSTSDAFNAAISDDLAAVGLNFVQFVGSGVGVCSVQPDAGFPQQAGGVVTVEWASFPLGASCEIVFEAALDVSVVPGNTVENIAELNWTSTENPNDETRDYNTQDGWGVVVSLPGVNKTITTSSVDETEDQEKGGDVVDLTIGEEVTYQVTVSFQNGTTQQAVFVDQLPTANVVLRVVSSRMVSIGADLTVPDAGVGDPGDDCLITTCDTNGDSERDLASWNLGDVVNVAGLDGVADDVVFEVIAVVVDSVNNEGAPDTDLGELNTGTLEFVNDAGVQSLFDTEPVDIVAPELEILKNALCIDEDASGICEADEPIGDPLVINGGDTLIYEVTLQHTPESTAHAFGAEVVDRLPTDLAFGGVASVVAIVGPAPDTVIESPTDTVTFSWNDPMPPGSTYTFQYQITVDIGVTGGQQLTNRVDGSWNSTGDPSNPENRGGTAGDQETVVVESPTFVKEVINTSLDDTGEVVHDPLLPDVTIGELVTYQLTAIIPAGVTGTGLTFVDIVPDPQMGIVGGRVVSVDDDLLPTGAPGAPVAVDNDANSIDERIDFDFGDVTNSGTTVGQIVVEVTAVVLDDPANVGTPDQDPAPTTLTNNGALQVNGGTLTDTADIEVVEPELLVTKRMGPVEDGFVTITIELLNDGTAAAFDPVVTDEFDEAIWVPLSATAAALPSGFELDQASAAGATTVTIDLVGAPIDPSADQIIVPGETAVFTFKMQLQSGGTPPITDDLENVANGEASTLPGDDDNERENSDSGTATIDLPSLEVVKAGAPTPTPAVPGGTITYRIDVENVGNADATNVVVTDTPDPNGEFQAGSVVVMPGGTVLLGNSGEDTSISVLVATIPAGATATITYDVVVPNPIPSGLEELVNQAVADSDELPPVDSDDLTDPTAEADPTVVPLIAAPDLAVEKSDGDVDVTAGGTVVYTIDYSNGGNQAATGIVLTETVPTGTVFDAAASAPSVWSCADQSPPDTVCTISIAGPVAGGEGGTESFAVVVDSPLPAGVDEVANTVSVADDGANGADPDPDNNDGSDTTPIDAVPDLELTKTDGDISVVPGGVIPYTLSYANIGDQDATGVVISETVPDNTTFDEANSTPTWSCVDEAPAGTVCTYDLGDLAVDASGSVVFAVTVDLPFPLDTPAIDNSAAIADDGGNGAEIDTDNNEDDDSTPVTITPALDAIKDDGLFIDADGSTDVSSGDTVRYFVTITNSGDTELRDVVFDDAPDTNTALVVGSVQTSVGSVTSGNAAGDTLVSVDIGLLPYQAAAMIRFDVTVNDPVVPPPGDEVIFAAALQSPTALYEIDLQTLDARTLPARLRLRRTGARHRYLHVPGDTLGDRQGDLGPRRGRSHDGTPDRDGVDDPRRPVHQRRRTAGLRGGQQDVVLYRRAAR